MGGLRGAMYLMYSHYFGLKVHSLSVNPKKVLELHNAGVDTKITDEVNKVVRDVHDVIDQHHTNAGLKNDQEMDKER